MDWNGIVEKISFIISNSPLDAYPCTEISEIYNIFFKKHGCKLSGLLAIYIYGLLNKSQIDGQIDG